MNEFNNATAPQPVQTAQAPNTKKQVKKCYNWACASLLFQFLIANAIAFAGMFIYVIVLTVKIMADNPDIDPNEVSKKVTEAMPDFIILLNAVAYLVANTVSYFIATGVTKKTYKARISGKIKLPAADSVLCVLAILGLQGLSMIVQSVVMSLTQTSGINSDTAAMFSFSDNIVNNVIMVIYFVFIAAITEELLCRGVVMKLLSPVSSTFAVVASSLLFGLMHGNFNQIFNGFLLGLVLGYAAMKSKSIWLPIICHMAANTNAMVLSFGEYKFGEKFVYAELIYAIALIVIGIIAIVLLLKRNGKLDNSGDRFPCEKEIAIPAEEEKALKWKLLITSPCFWIFTAIYLITAIAMLTPLSSI